ncbi:DUF6011 domain-containing protein [Streptomyces sp. NPDC050509]|uniref:DUF6011 domain-containing protein n=1 Tax=Streptomyces sp. NPDC050509 TaxID=3365620 RepID=UPI003797F8E4
MSTMSTTTVHCQVCGRPLRTDGSRNRRTGPKCAAKLRALADRTADQLTVGAP